MFELLHIFCRLGDSCSFSHSLVRGGTPDVLAQVLAACAPTADAASNSDGAVDRFVGCNIRNPSDEVGMRKT
jgi:hypothetical protein